MLEKVINWWTLISPGRLCRPSDAFRSADQVVILCWKQRHNGDYSSSGTVFVSGSDHGCNPDGR